MRDVKGEGGVTMRFLFFKLLSFIMSNNIESGFYRMLFCYLFYI
jgi:hypothetical protein